MTKDVHLWAVGFDEMGRAEHFRHTIMRLGESHCLNLLNTAIVVRYPDGSVTLDGEPYVASLDFRGHSFASFLAALALGAPPLTGAAVGGLTGRRGSAADVGIDDAFICEVESLMKPGTSALFVLDQEVNMDAILQGIRGLGGTVLKTNVDVNRARLIQSTLAANQRENQP
jgi:uncharacterized membrane protein